MGFDSLVSAVWSVLAFLPVSKVIDGFVELTEDNDLPQELVSYFETHYTGGEGGWGPQWHRVEPTFSIELQVYQQTCDNMLRTYNTVEDCHNAIPNSVTNTHPRIWRLMPLLMKGQILAKKEKPKAKWREMIMQKKKNSV